MDARKLIEDVIYQLANNEPLSSVRAKASSYFKTFKK